MKSSTDLGFIYFIEHDRAVKIGYSKQPKKRLRELQTASDLPLRLTEIFVGKLSTEKTFHKKFKDRALGNEWYPLSLRSDAIVYFSRISNPCADPLSSKVSKTKSHPVSSVLSKADYVRGFIDVDGMLACPDLVHYQFYPLLKLVEFGSLPETVSQLGFGVDETIGFLGQSLPDSIGYLKKILALFDHSLVLTQTIKEGPHKVKLYRIVKTPN